MAQTSKLGHVVLNVKSLARSVPFYRDVIGLKEVARLGAADRDLVGGDMVFFAFADNHHDLALREVPKAGPMVADAIGLAHVAICIGTEKSELRAFWQRVKRSKTLISHARDHAVSLSVYLKDPDGIVVEVYVDCDPQTWFADRSVVATLKPLDLHTL